MRVFVMVGSALVGCAMLAIIGYLVGEFSPGGMAAFGQPFSRIRDIEAQNYAVIGGVMGLIVGIMIGGAVKVGSSASPASSPTALPVASSQGRGNRDRVAAAFVAVLGIAACWFVASQSTVLYFFGALFLWLAAVLALGQKSVVHRALIGLPIAIVAAVLVVMVASEFTPPDDTQARVAKELAAIRDPLAADALAQQENIKDVKFKTLWQAFQDNEVAAQSTYGSGRVRFAANVQSVDRRDDGIRVTVDTGNFLEDGWAMLRKGDELAVAELKPKHKAVLICAVGSKQINTLRMSDCSIGSEADIPVNRHAVGSSKRHRRASDDEESSASE